MRVAWGVDTVQDHWQDRARLYSNAVCGRFGATPVFLYGRSNRRLLGRPSAPCTVFEVTDVLLSGPCPARSDLHRQYLCRLFLFFPSSFFSAASRHPPSYHISLQHHRSPMASASDKRTAPNTGPFSAWLARFNLRTSSGLSPEMDAPVQEIQPSLDDDAPCDWRSRAYTGDPHAQVVMGMLHESGRGVERRYV